MQGRTTVVGALRLPGAVGTAVQHFWVRKAINRGGRAKAGPYGGCYPSSPVRVELIAVIGLIFLIVGMIQTSRRPY